MTEKEYLTKEEYEKDRKTDFYIDDQKFKRIEETLVRIEKKLDADISETRKMLEVKSLNTRKLLGSLITGVGTLGAFLYYEIQNANGRLNEFISLELSTRVNSLESYNQQILCHIYSVHC